MPAANCAHSHFLVALRGFLGELCCSTVKKQMKQTSSPVTLLVYSAKTSSHLKLLIAEHEGDFSSLVKMPLKEKQKAWVDTVLSFNVTMLLWIWFPKIKLGQFASAHLTWSSIPMFVLLSQNTNLLSAQLFPTVSNYSLDNSATSVSCVYLSITGLVGGGVDFDGDDTGLVTASVPFRRLFFTSAILHGCAGTWFLLFCCLFNIMDRTQFQTCCFTMASLQWFEPEVHCEAATSCCLPSAWSALWWYGTQPLFPLLRHKQMHVTLTHTTSEVLYTLGYIAMTSQLASAW